MKNFDIAIIGASSLLAKSAIFELESMGLMLLKVSSKKNIHNHQNYVVWDYKTELPEIVSRCKYIIVFSKFNSTKECRTAINLLAKSTSEYNQIIVISSLAVLSRPKNFFYDLIFVGDDYIRLKKFADNIYSKKFKNVKIIYPGLVCGDQNLSWQKFIDKVKSADEIRGVNDISAGINLIQLKAFSSLFYKSIYFSEEKKIILPQSVVAFEELIKDRCIVLSCNNLFYDGWLKNLIFALLLSKFVPNFMALRILGKLRSLGGGGSVDAASLSANYNIAGMTRFYINSRIMAPY
jgi:hypothetical protein